MNLWTRDDDGVRRLFGIPVGAPWGAAPALRCAVSNLRTRTC